MSFSSLGLSSALLKAIDQKKYTAPYPVQKEAIPAILNGKDVLGIAQTGAGKTAGYVLPILEQMQRNAARLKNRHVKVLVLVPTRELAVQIFEAFDTFGDFLPSRIKCMAVYGGVSINPQMMQLQGTEILIATPGRLLELIGVNAVSLSSVQTLVLDEADKMLNLGFKDEMDKVLALLPKKRQTLLFSATVSSDLDAIHKNLLREPVVVQVKEEKENLDLIEQTAYLISEEKKGPLLRFIIRQNNMRQVLVFASSVHRADSIVVKLNANGIEASAIHSKKSQGARTMALRLFKSGAVRVLVATDLMSRGIDIKELPVVINYELPRSPKDYIHRIGRTGRAGAKGEAISLVSPEEEAHFRVIQKKMGKVATLVDGNALNLHGF